MANEYSSRWFDLFLRQVDESQTRREVDFLRQFLPLPQYRRVLDLCCGAGRHCGPLAQSGYDVTGVDRDSAVLAEASGNFPGARFVRSDMRELSKLGGTYDGILSLWQSFGYFDDTANLHLLREIHSLLNPNGRFILDIYHRGFFVSRQGSRVLAKGPHQIREHLSMSGSRLRVELEYLATGEGDCFEWRLYEPHELNELAREIGFEPHVACSNFDPNTSASKDLPRMQFVLERPPTAPAARRA